VMRRESNLLSPPAATFPNENGAQEMEQNIRRFVRDWFMQNAHVYDGMAPDDTDNLPPTEVAFGTPRRGRTRCFNISVSPLSTFPPDYFHQNNTVPTMVGSVSPRGLSACVQATFDGAEVVSTSRIDLVNSYLPLPLVQARRGRRYSGLALGTYPAYGLNGAKVDVTPWLLPKETADAWGKDFYWRMKEEVCFTPSFWRGDAAGVGPLVRLGLPVQLPDTLPSSYGFREDASILIPRTELQQDMRGMIILAARLKDFDESALNYGAGPSGLIRVNIGLGVYAGSQFIKTQAIPDADRAGSDLLLTSTEIAFPQGGQRFSAYLI